MAGTAVRALLFLAGGVAAAAVTAYVSGALDPYLGRAEAPIAAQPDAATPKTDTKTARLPGENGEVPSAQPSATPAEPGGADAAKPGTTAQETPAGAVLAPSFDIVRVEPDGSIVLAGKAAPNAKVEIVIGSEVIANATAGPAGDFAVALDQRLKPGSHQIVLRSTAPDNVVATSPETAIVSIPETKDGQVLALVEQPGVPSKLISVPEPAKAEAQDQSKAAEPSDQNAAATQTPPATEEKPAAPSGQTSEQQAAVSPTPAPEQSEPAPKPGEPMVKVEAVEIEGRKIFIAGAADPGRKVRAYANDILLGEVITSPGGRFLIETERDLPVGDYIIRVDGLEPDGSKVVARAAVPFEREPGEAIAAVAPNTNAPGGQAAGAGGAAHSDGGDKAATPTPPAGAGEIAATTPEALAPKLESVDGAVIIRRGDSLWRISRRVYGLGVRYSTIYLANQDQISDPDRLWPGQVFKVRDKTQVGEAADMEAIGNQATTAPR
jgi:nucleoid-associated protein YgaU